MKEGGGVLAGEGRREQSRSSQIPGKRERRSRGEVVLSGFPRDFSTRVMPSSGSQKSSDRLCCWFMQGSVFLLIHSTNEWISWDSRYRTWHWNIQQLVEQIQTLPSRGLRSNVGGGDK